MIGANAGISQSQRATFTVVGGPVRTFAAARPRVGTLILPRTLADGRGASAKRFQSSF